MHQSALGDRFALALSLCYAVLQWHASGWLHKDINTENIVFLNNRSGPPAISAPKLLGFGSSRPDELSEESLMTLPDEGTVDWFRHPDYRFSAAAKFHLSYDYYSLGVVLLAIGWWDTVNNLAKKYVQRHPSDSRNPRRWAEFLVKRVETSIGSTCGQIYRSVVLRCLRGDFGLDEIVTRSTVTAAMASGNGLSYSPWSSSWRDASPFCIDHWLEEKRRPKAGVKHRSLSWPNVKLFLACRRYPRSS